MPIKIDFDRTCSTSSIAAEVAGIIQELNSRQEVLLTQEFLTILLPQVVLCTYEGSIDSEVIYSDEKLALFLVMFIMGAIATFKKITLSKGCSYEK